MLHPHIRANRRSRGFTLVELLTVIVIMALLIVMVAPNVFQALSGTSLTTAGDLVRNKLTQAQQEAIAKNTPVEVRFYKYTDRDYSEDGDQVRAIQLFRLQNDPVNPFVRIEEPTYLEGGVVLSSKVLTPSGELPDAMSSFTDFDSPDDEGYCTRSTNGASYWAFRFYPDGSTNLPGNRVWYYTALSALDEQREETPKNFYTIQIDPLTGAVRTFRPGD